jgi:membrane associated rhomboid family serine protease
MIIPLRTDIPLRRTPYMNWALIAANVAVFLVQLYHNPQDPSQSNFVEPLTLQAADPHLWQYVTYAFLHANWLHLIGNMLFLYIFGNNINDRMGHLGYLAFYLAGAVFAGIGYVLFQRTGNVLGASGAVAAVTGAYLILLPHSNVTIIYFFFFIGVVEIASLWFILFFFMTDVLGQAMPQLLGGDVAVAHMAHISGTLFGAIVCVVLLLTHLLPRDQFDIVALGQRWNRRRQYRDMVNRGYNPFDYGGPARFSGSAPVKPPSAEELRLMELRARISQAAAGHDMAQAAELYLDLIRQDPNQVMARTVQLDIANHLAHQQRYAEAAAAYEQFLRFYPKYEQIEQVDLMLGVIYSRHLNRPQRARECLLRAISRLHFSREIEMARAELAHVEATIGPGTAPP